MKNCLAGIAILSAALVQGQQLDMRNQYFFDLMYVNAAYTGHPEAISASTILRKQWVGFDGAPETFNMAIHSPLKNQNMGIGFQAAYDKIGPRTATSLSLTYAYAAKLTEKTKLRFGLRATAENHSFDWDKIDYYDQQDVIKDQGSQSTWIPAFDFAVLATGERFFAGVEFNNLSQSKIRDVETSISRQYLHGRLIGGYLFELSPKVSLKPTVLMRYAVNAPFHADINLNALFLERFWLGAGYRYNYGLLAMVQFRVTNNLEVGYAYDFATNRMQSHHAGSHELFLSYRFNVFKANFSSPRYF
jgi:type IX secretion system PorP/SprF family membrane protein